MEITTETKVGAFIIAACAIFMYMNYKIGTLRFDTARYAPYSIHFNDVAGLERKADIKIAGVKVGWVNDVRLLEGGNQAQADIMVLKDYTLRSDAVAAIRQDGLLGTKYIELVPGSLNAESVTPGYNIGRPGDSPANIDSILREVQSIAQTLNRTLCNNESNINGILSDFRNVAADIKDAIPAFKNSVEKIAATFDRDLNRVGNASDELCDGLQSIKSVAHKIDCGEGVLGKLINEDETYHDLKYTVRNIKDYIERIDQLEIIFDSHGEYMFKPSDEYLFRKPDPFAVQNSKGYLDIRIHPNDDYFYLIQFISDIQGNLKRREYQRNWYDEHFNPLLPAELLAENKFIPELIGRVDTIKRDLDAVKYSAQFCKVFKDFTFRAGLMESFGGVGVDFEIPFHSDRFRWITTFEAFDFRGRNKVDDDRPHLKWMNRMFFMRNLYINFGVDDFVSKRNANGFFGFGLRFSDETIKYVASKFGFYGVT